MPPGPGGLDGATRPYPVGPKANMAGLAIERLPATTGIARAVPAARPAYSCLEPMAIAGKL
jgi:hypothetical protein